LNNSSYPLITISDLTVSRKFSLDKEILSLPENVIYYRHKNTPCCVPLTNNSLEGFHCKIKTNYTNFVIDDLNIFFKKIKGNYT
jgi:hypothetical protein